MWLRDWLSHLTGRDLLERAVVTLNRVEANMAAVDESLARLGAAVAGVADRVNELSEEHRTKVAELETALQAERDAAAATAAAEDAEDVEQNQALADAKAATDAALAEVQGVGAAIDEQAARLNEVAPVAPDAVDETPETPAQPEAPVVGENPDLTTPDDNVAPVENGQPDAGPTPVAPGATDGGTPAS